MTEKNGRWFVPDWDVYNRNRSNFPLEELAKYGDEWVAWSPDGSRIVAHDKELQKVDEMARAAGHDPEQVILERIPAGGEVTLL